MPKQASWLAQYRVEDYENYEPVLDRVSTERRVLGFITDEDHAGRGPRNTVERLSFELEMDEYTQFAGNFDQMQGYLDTLENEKLVAHDEDGVYSLTEAGFVELAN
jgi:hypothetical protein